MHRKSATSLLLVVLLACGSLVGACTAAPMGAPLGGERSLQSNALPPAGDAGQ